MTTQVAAQELTYREAIREALAEEMRRDDSVLLMGEDIGPAGGPFKTTEGLYEEFGKERVRDTPIAETGFVGAALGLAVTGFRPIVEIMFADFMGVCYDQIVNSIAKYRFMAGGAVKVPLVIRTIGGGGLRFGAQHSQSGESWLLGVPGLKVVCASTPQEAYLMIKAAVRDDNPVVVIEHKALLTSKGPVQRDEALLEGTLSGPAVRRTGKDVTIVSSLAMVGRALEAAERLAAEGVAAEVIDLRVLRPMGLDAVAASVRKTNLLVTVEELHQVGGWGAEVVAQVVEKAFDYLDAPPTRVCLPDHPLPYSPPLEDAAIPTAERIAEAVRRIL
jgi:pyruvate/2-oxoglutarate/acetoin dehydrogenase E1 component